MTSWPIRFIQEYWVIAWHCWNLHWRIFFNFKIKSFNGVKLLKIIEINNWLCINMFHKRRNISFKFNWHANIRLNAFILKAELKSYIHYIIVFCIIASNLCILCSFTILNNPFSCIFSCKYFLFYKLIFEFNQSFSSSYSCNHFVGYF